MFSISNIFALNPQEIMKNLPISFYKDRAEAQTQSLSGRQVCHYNSFITNNLEFFFQNKITIN